VNKAMAKSIVGTGNRNRQRRKKTIERKICGNQLMREMVKIDIQQKFDIDITSNKSKMSSSCQWLKLLENTTRHQMT
jgi:hypothetical protein